MTDKINLNSETHPIYTRQTADAETDRLREIIGELREQNAKLNLLIDTLNRRIEALERAIEDFTK